jgi:hypothetical protein
VADLAVKFVWGAGEPDVEVAGWEVAQGSLGLQLYNHPVTQKLVKMRRDLANEVP